MRTFRLSVCVLIAGALFILCACHKEQPKLKCDVQISSDQQGTKCTVNPKKAEAQQLGKFCWQGDSHDYTIRFKDPNEPIPGPIHVNHGVPDPPHPIKGKKGCENDPAGGVYCKYSVTRDNESKPCADFDDPGIHIIG